MRTYEDLKAEVLRHGFKWFLNPYSLNFIWERTSYHATNVFDDWLHIAYMDTTGIGQVLSIPVTTKPGLKGSLLEPVTVEHITGTAVITASQQVIGGWQFHDTDQEFSKYPYFRQIAPVDYWRDGNKDHEIDKINEQNDKIFDTHWHKMSQNGTYGSGQVNNWSEGCMGGPEPEWKKILPLVRKSVAMYGDKFTGTILDKW